MDSDMIADEDYSTSISIGATSGQEKDSGAPALLRVSPERDQLRDQDHTNLDEIVMGTFDVYRELERPPPWAERSFSDRDERLQTPDAYHTGG